MPLSLFAFKYRLAIVPLSLLSEGGIVPECLRMREKRKRMSVVDMGDKESERVRERKRRSDVETEDLKIERERE